MSIKPATDEAIEFCVGMGTLRAFERSLIARIRIERENAIKECAEILTDYMVASRCSTEYNGFDNARDRVLSLLKAPSSQEADK